MRAVTASILVVGAVAGVLSLYLPTRDASVNPAVALAVAAYAVVVGGAVYLVRWEGSPLTYLLVRTAGILLVWGGALAVSGWSRSQFLWLAYPLVVFTSVLYPLAWTVFFSVLVGLGILAIALSGGAPPAIRAAVANAPLLPVVAYFTAALNRRLLAEHEEREYLSSLMEVSRISTSLDLKQTLQSTAEFLKQALDAHSCVIYLVDTSNGRLSPEVVTTVPGFIDAGEEEFLRSVKPRIGEGITGWVAETGEAILSGDAKKDPRARLIPGLPVRDLSYIVVPAAVEGRVTGVIRISRAGLNQYSHRDLQIATVFANQAAIAIENARLYETTRQLTITDGLTGLYNARYLTERLEGEINRARRYGHRLSLAMIDSDSLKQINDQFGHQQGDRAVRETGLSIRSSVRQSDIVFRYAGDEFVVLMPETDVSTAYLVLERIRRRVEEHYLRVDGHDVRMTVSAGVATFPDHAGDAEDLIRAADEAMYRAKGAGKNRVMVYSRPGSPLASS